MSSTTGSWLPDPEQPGLLRWHDGTQWTSHTHPDPAAAPQPTMPAPGFAPPASGGYAPPPAGGFGSLPAPGGFGATPPPAPGAFGAAPPFGGPQAPPPLVPPPPTMPAYQPAYGAGGFDGRRSAKGLAIGGMVLGICAIVLALPCFPVGALCGIIGLPLSIVGRKRTGSPEYLPDGRGQAMAGIVTCIIGLALAIAVVVLIVVAGNIDTTFNT